MKSSTETLIKALEILAQEIESPDGVANAAVGEAAERLRELSAERDALRVQGEQLREKLQLAHTYITCADETGYIDDVGFVDPDAVALELESAIESTPAHCLAEVRAQVIEDLEHPLYLSGKCDADIGEWLKQQANQIRQQAKGE